MRRWFMVLVTGLLMATAVAVLPAAAVPQPQPLPWEECPTGTATTGSFQMERTDPAGTATRITGWIDPCGTPAPGNRYIIMAYGSRGELEMLAHRRYRSAERYSFEMSLMEVPTWITAACLVTYYDARPACVSFRVSHRPPGGSGISWPMSPDRPPVNRTLTRDEVRYVPYPPGAPCPECYV